MSLSLGPSRFLSRLRPTTVHNHKIELALEWWLASGRMYMTLYLYMPLYMYIAMLCAPPFMCDLYKYASCYPSSRIVACRLPRPPAVVHSFYTTILFIRMFPETAAPSLLFISSLVSLILIFAQLSSLHKSQWDVYNAQGFRRLLALSVTLLIVFLSALSGTLGLIACQAWRTGDRSRATRAGIGGKIVIITLQSGLSVYIMFLLNLKALVEPIPSQCIGILTLGNVRIFTAVMSSPLIAITVLSIVFAVLQEDYPAARLPALCWLLFFIPLSCVSTLLYLFIRRAKEYSIIARMWLVLAVGHACGALSAACALVGKGDFQAPTSLFDAFWITCVTFALHSCVVPSPRPSLRLLPYASPLYPTRSLPKSSPFRKYSFQARGVPPPIRAYPSS
ncbi:hypothetical protein F5148DRAFT_339560 [Russula earlei]|uniref:Uncharacterized protein n=1 Tax=Russula earlei TaxID=71964 RepID=A0ACC0U222_9AGAM|nr:hypothetical protein F5148DRAFT_339560 [Russula earlei]